MSDHNNSTEIETVPCEICLKEIPRSEAQTSEIDDYVLHFCGIDCYTKWQKENKKDK